MKLSIIDAISNNVLELLPLGVAGNCVCWVGELFCWWFGDVNALCWFGAF